MVEKATAAATDSAAGKGASRIVVVDIGKKQTKKAIKRLRQGRGKLMPKVEAAVKEVQEETKTTNTLPIVIVIEKKQSRRWLW
jgi:hypothetical protein